MNKSEELSYIDEFISLYNSINAHGESVIRISDENQEKPDALCRINNQKIIGLETSFIIRRLDMPYIPLDITNSAEVVFNPLDAIENLRQRIASKNLKLERNYKPENPTVHEFWLLLVGASLISIKALEDNLRQHPIAINFDRVFIFKGLVGDADYIEFKLDS